MSLQSGAPVIAKAKASIRVPRSANERRDRRMSPRQDDARQPDALRRPTVETLRKAAGELKDWAEVNEGLGRQERDDFFLNRAHDILRLAQALDNLMTGASGRSSHSSVPGLQEGTGKRLAV